MLQGIGHARSEEYLCVHANYAAGFWQQRDFSLLKERTSTGIGTGYCFWESGYG